MNINGLGNLFGSNAAGASASVGGVPGTGSPSSIPPPMGAAGGAVSASISTPGQFMSEMQQLSQTNPTEFKSVASQVAAAFQNAASQASGPGAQLLTNLANQFSQAAQTGSLQAGQGAQASSMAQAAQGAQSSQSGQGSGGHHHHHHHGGGGASQSSAVMQAFQSAFDILDQATQGSSSSTSASSSTST